MANKGLVMDMPYMGTTYYLLLPGLIGFMEITFMRNRSDLPMKKLAQLMHDYLSDPSENGMAKEFFGSKTQLTRALVYEEHIPVTSHITSYESAVQIIKKSDFGAVTQCYCRHKKEHLGKKCKKNAPVENFCIVLGSGARFLTRRGFAQRKTRRELLKILDHARSLNLTHTTDNIRHKPSFICNCCNCCCELLQGVQMGYHDGIAKTNYIAEIDGEKCNYCGDCFKACNVKSISLAKNMAFKSKSERYAAVYKEICLGCAACISSCKQKALTMIPCGNGKLPPYRKKDLFARILWEKGRLTPFLLGRLKKSVRNFLRI
jgi:ferredoxin